LGKYDNGIGLSAIQIGIPKRIFVIKHEQDEEMVFDNFINPEVVDCEGEFTFAGEGCLSFPGLYLNTKRFYHYTIKRGLFDEGGYREETDYFYYPETVEEYTTRENSISSIAVQHEMDHLSGLVLPEYGVKNVSIQNVEDKVGRNDSCPCGKKKADGSPIKYKRCCGK